MTDRVKLRVAAAIHANAVTFWALTTEHANLKSLSTSLSILSTLSTLDSSKFLEILNRNKKSNKFSIDQLKICFKNPSCVREPF